MPWNYRVMQKDGEWAVHEVFYDGTGCINGFTTDPVFPTGESLEDLREERERYSRALTEPVLDFHQIELEAAARRGE